MPHRSNGKRRLPASEPLPRFGGEAEFRRPTDPSWEDRFSATHEIIVERATRFIRERPAASLMLAAAVGGMIGWLVKRRNG